MSNLALVKSTPFGTVACDFWENEQNDIFMTINQLAQALGYASKSGIENMVSRNDYLKDVEFSCTHKMWVGNSEQETRIFTEDGIYEVSMLSKTPVAKDFRQWVRKIIKALRKGEVTTQPIKSVKTDAQKQLEIDTRVMNAKTRQARLLLNTAKDFKDILAPEAIQLLISDATSLIGGQTALPKPQIAKMYTASEIGEKLGVSANKIGRLANKYNLKTEEYGIWVLDKSKYAAKQVRSFQYNDTGLKKLNEVLQQEKK